MSRKEAWTHCHVCGKGISNANPKNTFFIESSFLFQEKLSWQSEPTVGYSIKTYVTDPHSWFYLCTRCSKEIDSRLRRLIRRFEKEFGSKKRWRKEKRQR